MILFAKVVFKILIKLCVIINLNMKIKNLILWNLAIIGLDNFYHSSVLQPIDHMIQFIEKNIKSNNNSCKNIIYNKNYIADDYNNFKDKINDHGKRNLLNLWNNFFIDYNESQSYGKKPLSFVYELYDNDYQDHYDNYDNYNKDLYLANPSYGFNYDNNIEANHLPKYYITLKNNKLIITYQHNWNDLIISTILLFYDEYNIPFLNKKFTIEGLTREDEDKINNYIKNNPQLFKDFIIAQDGNYITFYEKITMDEVKKQPLLYAIVTNPLMKPFFYRGKKIIQKQINLLNNNQESEESLIKSDDNNSSSQLRIMIAEELEAMEKELDIQGDCNCCRLHLDNLDNMAIMLWKDFFHRMHLKNFYKNCNNNNYDNNNYDYHLSSASQDELKELMLPNDIKIYSYYDEFFHNTIDINKFRFCEITKYEILLLDYTINIDECYCYPDEISYRGCALIFYDYNNIPFLEEEFTLSKYDNTKEEEVIYNKEDVDKLRNYINTHPNFAKYFLVAMEPNGLVKIYRKVNISNNNFLKLVKSTTEIRCFFDRGYKAMEEKINRFYDENYIPVNI